jgi:hypothetical protein
MDVRAGGLALVAAVAALVPARAAAADVIVFDASYQANFTAVGGARVTCEVEVYSSLDRDSDVAHARTGTSGAPAACANSVVSVTATWRDTHGFADEGSATSHARVLADFFHVDSGYSVRHDVEFQACDEDCTFSVTSRPK